MMWAASVACSLYPCPANRTGHSHDHFFNGLSRFIFIREFHPQSEGAGEQNEGIQRSSKIVIAFLHSEHLLVLLVWCCNSLCACQSKMDGRKMVEELHMHTHTTPTFRTWSGQGLCVCEGCLPSALHDAHSLFRNCVCKAFCRKRY